MALTDEALDIVKRVLVAHEEPPLEDMERLILLAQDNPELRLELLEGASEVLAADPASLVPCWLALIVGELGVSSADLLLSTLGTSEADALDETIVPVLMRHVGPLYGAITAALDEAPSEEPEYRAALYDVLTAVVVGDDADLKERLRSFVASRIEQERRMLPPHLTLVAPPAFLAAMLDGGAASEDGKERLARTSHLIGEDWRQTARDIANRFARTPTQS
jgi:hypothetical protein